MSLVICVKDNKGYYNLVADSQMSCANTFKYLKNDKTSKIFPLEGHSNCYIGFTGWFRYASILRATTFHDIFPKDVFNTNCDITLSNVVNYFIPFFIKKLTDLQAVDHSASDKFIDNNDVDQGIFLVVNKKAFQIKSISEVIEVDDIDFLGSGDETAMGAFNALARFGPKDDPVERAIKAIQVTAENNLYVGGDVIVQKCK